MSDQASPVILVVDDEPDVRTFVEMTLELSGYRVLLAHDGEQAISVATSQAPALIVMDVMMPNVDGVEACARLRSDPRTTHIPIILLTAKAQGQDKIRGLDAGADDYVIKPFDPDELLARIQSTLRRALEMRAVSPLTGLPGNPAIQAELARRVDHGPPFSLLYADLNTFKAYNDHYGFLRGDTVIRRLASVLLECANADAPAETFVGHIGGDDFAVMTSGTAYAELAQAICERFDAAVPELYDEADRERGFVEVLDRRGDPQRYPMTTVSIGVATSATRAYEHPSQLVSIATEMKNFAKRQQTGRSTWAVDRRHDDEAGGRPG